MVFPLLFKAGINLTTSTCRTHPSPPTLLPLLALRKSQPARFLHLCPVFQESPRSPVPAGVSLEMRFSSSPEGRCLRSQNIRQNEGAFFGVQGSQGWLSLDQHCTVPTRLCVLLIKGIDLLSSGFHGFQTHTIVLLLFSIQWKWIGCF